MQASGLIKFSQIMAEIDSDEEPFRLGHANNGIYETINVTNIIPRIILMLRCGSPHAPVT